MALPDPSLPGADPSRAAALVGVDSSHAGGLPAYLGIRTVDAGPGRITCHLDVRDDLLNPFGALHGGVIATLVDHVLGAVLFTAIERTHWPATTEFKLNLLAPVRSGGLTAEATIVSLGRRTAVVRVDVTNDGRAAGAAQGTVTIVPPKAPPAGA